MTYHISRTLPVGMDDAVAMLLEALKLEGFGIISDIDVSATLKAKIDVDFRPYRILGACNPFLAHQALLREAKIGIMLPCNIVIQEGEDGGVDISAVDPHASLMAVNNSCLYLYAGEVRERLQRVIDNL